MRIEEREREILTCPGRASFVLLSSAEDEAADLETSPVVEAEPVSVSDRRNPFSISIEQSTCASGLMNLGLLFIVAILKEFG